jgi:hypothetical protein
MSKTLILHNQGDLTASWVASYLHQKMGIDAWLVSAEDLIYATKWNHYVANNTIQTEIILQNGKIIDSTQIKILYNRISHISMPHFTNITNRNYAEIEMTALILSFLKSLGNKTINLPHPRGLGKIDLSDYFFLQTAISYRLPIHEQAFSSNPKLFSLPSKQQLIGVKDPTLDFLNRINLNPTYTKAEVLDTKNTLLVNNQIIGALPMGINANNVFQMLRSLGCSIAELTWILSDKRWKLSKINTLPEISSLKGIDAVAKLLMSLSMD